MTISSIPSWSSRLRSKQVEVAGKIAMKTYFGEIKDFNEFVVINVDASYNVLLDMCKNEAFPPYTISCQTRDDNCGP